MVSTVKDIAKVFSWDVDGVGSNTSNKGLDKQINEWLEKGYDHIYSVKHYKIKSVTLLNSDGFRSARILVVFSKQG